MNNRFMRMLVMFDLPTDTSEDKRQYRYFRKFLIKNSFIMLQESVYCKLAMNETVAEGAAESIKKHKPKKGSVIILRITENQYQKMEYVLGKKNKKIIDSTERIVIF